jgi:pimeloyl-[acyl-carrier protein] methyl ester esterase
MHTTRILLARIGLILIAFLAFALGGARTALAQEPGFVPTRFSVEISGEGPDVIFIPGLATSRGVWKDAVATLGPGYRVHLVQIKGFGEPAGPNAQGPVLGPLVEELARYVIDNRIERPAVVGHSLGGLMALMLGADHPALPGKLMIVDVLPWFGATVTPPGANATVASIEPQARQVRDAMIASYGTPQAGQGTEAAIAGYVVDQAKLPLLRGWTRDADPRVVGQLVYEDLTTDWRDRIADIAAPLILIYPWNERYPTQAQAEPFYRTNYAGLPQAKLVGIGPAAHFVMTDQPVAFQEELERFLRD